MEGPVASVGFNGDFFSVTTMSAGAGIFGDPEVGRIYLPAGVSDWDLGGAARQAIKQGRVVGVDEFMEIFKSGVVQKVAKEREEFEIRKFGYKNRKDMLIRKRVCYVEIIGDDIEIQPSHANSLDGRSSDKVKGPFPLYVGVNSDDAELGAAIREGLSRCTSRYW